MASVDLGHLHRAEQLLVKLRILAVVSLTLMVLYAPLTVPRDVAGAVLAASALYTALTVLHVRRGRHVLAGSMVTAIGDVCVATGVCACTGGIESGFYPFFYLTSIATSIRFGTVPAFAMAAFQSVLSAGLWAFAPAPAGESASLWELGLRVFYLVFTPLLGSALSRNVSENLEAARFARDRARELLRRLIHAEEEERKRIASDLHDRMGARFFELSYGIDRARGAFGDAQPEAAKYLARLGADARACGDEIRELMNELRPTVLDDFGVSEALREWGMALQAQSDMSVKLSIDPDANAARSDVNLALFRIAQEAVLNARKHADARELEIALLRDPVADRIVLSVRDDGCGFDASVHARGRLGLLTMRERAEACGGTLEVQSALGRGTHLRAIVPAGAPA